jgi:hypothetical protein
VLNTASLDSENDFSNNWVQAIYHRQVLQMDKQPLIMVDSCVVEKYMTSYTNYDNLSLNIMNFL